MYDELYNLPLRDITWVLAMHGTPMLISELIAGTNLVVDIHSGTCMFSCTGADWNLLSELDPEK